MIVRVKAQIILILAVSISAFAGYEIPWHTIDGGGGTSSGEQYSVSGTIAQADAGYSEGEQYEVLGGFWPGEPLCVVDFYHFALFAQYWLEDGPNPADLYEDAGGIVDELDLAEFVNYWLWYCPLDWSLK